MVAKLGLAMLFLTAAGLGAGSADAATLRQAKYRPDIVEIGDPVLVGHAVIEREMAVNSALRDFVQRYGWPDYAEIQEVAVQDPWAAYEFRTYYLRRDHYVVFGRVYVSPSVEGFGMMKFDGPIDPEALNRVLTAPPVDAVDTSTSDAAPPMVVEPQASADTARAEVVALAEPAEPTEVLSDVSLEAKEGEAAVIGDAPLPMEEAAPVEAVERAPGSPDLSQIVHRLEAAANRAALAAEEAEAASNAAVASANRATATLEKIAAAYEE